MGKEQSKLIEAANAGRKEEVEAWVNGASRKKLIRALHVSALIGQQQTW
jgi:hypothetical protein